MEFLRVCVFCGPLRPGLQADRIHKTKTLKNRPPGRHWSLKSWWKCWSLDDESLVRFLLGLWPSGTHHSSTYNQTFSSIYEFIIFFIISGLLLKYLDCKINVFRILWVSWWMEVELQDKDKDIVCELHLQKTHIILSLSAAISYLIWPREIRLGIKSWRPEPDDRW
jgi:hypothetical protein